MNQPPSESALPKAFRFAATACGLKKTGALDLALVSSDVPASAAAVFTQNLVVAAPVTLSKKNLRESKGRMRAVVVNAGNANCATGAQGELVAFLPYIKLLELNLPVVKCGAEHERFCCAIAPGEPG